MDCFEDFGFVSVTLGDNPDLLPALLNEGGHLFSLGWTSSEQICDHQLEQIDIHYSIPHRYITKSP